MSHQTRPGVLFDIDGTLLDTTYLHAVAWWRAFRDAGHEGISMAMIHRAIGLASAELTEHLLGSVDEDVVTAHSTRFEELQPLADRFPRAGDLVRRCAEAGLAPVLATSAEPKDLDWMLPLIGADDSIAGVTDSGDVERSKPAPDMLAVSVENHHLDPDATVVVGDSVWDMGSSLRARLPCIGLTSGGLSEAELREAGAVEVYADPADLLAHVEDSALARHRAG